MILVILGIDLAADFLLKTRNLTKIIYVFNEFKKNECLLIDKRYKLTNLINGLSSKIILNEFLIFNFDIEDLILIIDKLEIKSRAYSELFEGSNFNWVKKRLDYNSIKKKIKEEFIKTENAENAIPAWVFDYSLLIYDKNFEQNIKINKHVSDIRSCLLDELFLYAGPGPHGDPIEIVRFKRIEPKEIQDWQGIFANDFKKAIKNFDKNLQGRVFSAILEILESPVEARGDTQKPLTAEWHSPKSVDK